MDRAERRRTAALGGAAVLFGLLVAGCGGESPTSCLPTKLDAVPLTVPDLHTAAVVQARLTQDGKPVNGAKIGFAFTIEGRTTATTDERTGPDGVAQLRLPAGLAGVGFSGERVTGYEAGFKPFTASDGWNDHCWASSSAPVWCGTQGSACPPITRP